MTSKGVKINKDGGGGEPLRDWAYPSYDVSTGRSASSLNESRAGTSGANGNHTTRVSTQIGETRAGGQNGAPGVETMNRSGSGDTGRRRLGGSKLP